MATAPRWRILACINAPVGNTSGLGVFSTLLDLTTPETQPANAKVSVLYNPALDEFSNAVSATQPNFIYCCGAAVQPDDKHAGVIGSFRFKDQQGDGGEALLSALQGARPEVAYVDAAVSPYFGPALHHCGVSHVVVWPAGPPILAPVAAHFNTAFFAFLTGVGGSGGGSGASPAEAFAAASHGTQAHCSLPSPNPGGSSIIKDEGGAGAAGDAGGGGSSSGGGGGGSSGEYTSPPLPAFVSAVRPGLPDSDSIPPVEVTGLRLDAATLPSFPGWSDVRLLAPRAELRLLLVGGSWLIDSTRLSYLGEALRGLLIMEARGLQLLSCTPLKTLPRNLSPVRRAVRCGYVTASGAAGSVVLGAPPSVLGHEGLVQHALRMTLVADSVSLQFRLPPPGLSPPAPRTSRAVAGGAPVVDCVVVTSVWAVEVLRVLCRDPRYRSLAALGVAAVGNLADPSFSPADLTRLNLIAGGLGPTPITAAASDPAGQGGAAAAPPIEAVGSEPQPSTAPLSTETLPSPAAVAAGPDLDAAAASGGAFYGNDALMGYALNGQLQTLGARGGGGGGGDAAGLAAAAASPDSPDGAGADGGEGYGGGPGSRPTSRPAGPLSDRRPNYTGDLPGYTCRRPPLSCCSEPQFYDDLVDFLTVLRGRPIDRGRFPEAVLNGVSLDLFSLYREVVSRGGFRVGNGINWKGQVFPRMRNWTETNKQTGVGNALKRHYQNYLYEYEVAHPEDVTLDRCILCNGGDAVASDWVCCDACENWAHFSCDKRPGIGAFKDYAQGQGRVYVCPSCCREQEAGEAVKRQRTA